MSILIKGMEMPKDYSVIVKIFPDGRVGTIPYVQWFKVDLIPGTQAVPVPPHGRLIDADEFYKDINESILLTDGFKDAFNLWFDEQPTIIPASGEKRK